MLEKQSQKYLANRMEQDRTHSLKNSKRAYVEGLYYANRLRLLVWRR